MPPVPGQPCSNHKVRAYIYNQEYHHTPHFHLVCGTEWSLSMAIETGEVLAGDDPKLRKEIREAREWREKNIDLLRAIWSDRDAAE
jgi:hypothetical protein